MITPGGSCAWISATRFLTPCTTSRPFAPTSIMVMPVTASPSPSRVMVPKRIAEPICTRLTLRTKMGVPSSAVRITTASISCSFANRPTPRSVSASPLRSM